MKCPNTWADIYHKWICKDYDSAYAAWMADKWEKRKSNKQISKYFSELGKKGGAKSKRTITPEQQSKMQEAKKKKQLSDA